MKHVFFKYDNEAGGVNITLQNKAFFPVLVTQYFGIPQANHMKEGGEYVFFSVTDIEKRASRQANNVFCYKPGNNKVTFSCLADENNVGEFY